MDRTDERRDLEVVLITGFSGAGRSAAARVLEDIGYYVVDNLPPSMIPDVLRLAAEGSTIERVAIVADVRSRVFPGGVLAVVSLLKESGVRPTVVFLDASEEVLVRRFENVRREHPMQGDGTIVQGIEAEREVISPIRGLADVRIDTSALSVHDLRRRLEAVFAGELGNGIRLNLMSFGFKYGIPLDADLVFDVRFLPNPYWEPALRDLTGGDAQVSDYVLAQDGAADALTQLQALVQTMLPGYRREGKRYMVLAIGCTGGKHRSVAMTRALAARLEESGADTRVLHRDLGRE